jgi:hypothetical protein
MEEEASFCPVTHAHTTGSYAHVTHGWRAMFPPCVFQHRDLEKVCGLFIVRAALGHWQILLQGHFEKQLEVGRKGMGGRG